MAGRHGLARETTCRTSRTGDRESADHSKTRPVAALITAMGKARYGRVDLLLLDELGYVQVDPPGAELLFQIITEREELASIAIGTNLPFSEWGSVFPDPRLVAAIIDRVTFNAPILETGTESYRLRTSKTSTRRKRASRPAGTPPRR
jgi:hypothetical protein